MFRKVLYPVNFGDFYYENIDCFINYSKIGLKEVLLIHVIDQNMFQHGLYSMYNKDNEEKIKKMVEIKLEDIKKYLEKYGITVSYVIRKGNIADKIIEEAKIGDVDFIVLDKKPATKHKGYIHFYGSPLYEIIVRTDKPVLIKKRVLFTKHAANSWEGLACRNIFSDIVLATDFSESSLRAVPFINSIPDEGVSLLTLLHIIKRKSRKIVLNPRGNKGPCVDVPGLVLAKLDGIVKMLGSRFSDEKDNLDIKIRKGVPCREITDFINETKKRLLILGFKGRDKESLKEMFFGSTAERVINTLPCSILIVK